MNLSIFRRNFGNLAISFIFLKRRNWKERRSRSSIPLQNWATSSGLKRLIYSQNVPVCPNSNNINNQQYYSKQQGRHSSSSDSLRGRPFCLKPQSSCSSSATYKPIPTGMQSKNIRNIRNDQLRSADRARTAS